MNNFLRAIRLCLRFRWTLAAALVCSLLVGLFWGANIGAVLPLIRVLFRGESVLVAFDRDIADCRETIRELNTEIAELQSAESAATDAAPQTSSSLVRLQDRRRAEIYALIARQRLRPVVERWLPRDTRSTLLLVVGALVFATLLKSLFLMGNSVLVERAVRRAMLGVRKDYFGRALEMDLSQLGETGAGEITSQFTFDMNTLVVALRNLFGRATVEPLKMVACLVGAGLICWRLLILCLILAPPAAFLIRQLASSIKRSNRRAMEEMSVLVGRLGESLESLPVVKAFTMEEHEALRFEHRTSIFYRKSMRIAFYGSLVKPSMELLGIGVTCAALLAGGYLVLQEQTHLLGVKISDRPLSPEAMIAFFAMLVGMSDPARKMAGIYNKVQPGVPAADRIFGMIDRPPSISDPPRPKAVSRPHSMLAWEDVFFRYGDGTEVLRGVNLTIPHGETLAIVGPNGCGKSTLANLLLRFYDPTGGAVRLDNVDLRDIALADLRSRLALVSQQTLLFDDTIANNIRYGSPAASDAAVRAAAKRADAHDFIVSQCEAGYQTLVGPRGERLSGGQRQKIALARAILRDADILILDEATSQVDIESEQQVHAVLKDFVVGRTAVIITHRLSTLSLADRILVMEAGRVLDIGTHEQLLGRCGFYRRLHEIDLRQSA